MPFRNSAPHAGAVLTTEGSGVPWLSLGLAGRTAPGGGAGASAVKGNATVWKLFSREPLPHAWTEMLFESGGWRLHGCLGGPGTRDVYVYTAASAGVQPSITGLNAGLSAGLSAGLNQVTGVRPAQRRALSHLAGYEVAATKAWASPGAYPAFDPPGAAGACRCCCGCMLASGLSRASQFLERLPPPLSTAHHRRRHLQRTLPPLCWRPASTMLLLWRMRRLQWRWRRLRAAWQRCSLYSIWRASRLGSRPAAACWHAAAEQRQHSRMERQRPRDGLYRLV